MAQYCFLKASMIPTWRCAGWAMYAISLSLSCIWKICPCSLMYSLKMHLGAICCCNSQSCTVKQLRSETASGIVPCCSLSYYLNTRLLWLICLKWADLASSCHAIAFYLVGFHCQGSPQVRAQLRATPLPALATIWHPRGPSFQLACNNRNIPPQGRVALGRCNKETVSAI